MSEDHIKREMLPLKPPFTPWVPKARYDELRSVAEALASALECADALNSNVEYWGVQMNGIGQTYRDHSRYAIHCFRNGDF